MNDIIYNANNDNSHLFNANKKGKLICLEACDGVGKSTQIKIITDFLEKNDKTYISLHFPMYGKNDFSNIISMFLRGDLGENNKVDPLFVANIYAMDRYKSKPDLIKYLNTYDYVILDRYVHSNMAFQGAKYDEIEKIDGIVKWIDDFEFKFLKLPYPDLILYLDLPIDVVKERLINRTGDNREYLNGNNDIHEMDFEFQTKVRKMYLGLDNCENYNKINCLDDNGNTLSPVDVFNLYKSKIL